MFFFYLAPFLWWLHALVALLICYGILAGVDLNFEFLFFALQITFLTFAFVNILSNLLIYIFIYLFKSVLFHIQAEAKL